MQIPCQNNYIDLLRARACDKQNKMLTWVFKIFLESGWILED